MSSELEMVAVQFIACPLCGAEPGDRCRARRWPYRLSPFQHAGRTKAVYAAWRLGYFDGRNELANTPVENLEHARQSAVRDVAWWADNKPEYLR